MWLDNGKYKFTNLETGEVVESDMYIKNTEEINEFKVITRGYREKDFEYIVLSLEQLLNASIEVGNDIIWG